MIKLKKFLKDTFLVLLSSVILVVGLDLILITISKLTNANKLRTLPPLSAEVKPPKIGSEYPSNPEQYVKIALFGGSTAWGYNTEANFFDILRYELQKRYPDKKFFLAKYAEAGTPFDRYQAELAKKVAHKYDILLIYAGINEVLNYVDDTGYFRKPEYKKVYSFKPPRLEAFEEPQRPPGKLFRWIYANSRLVSLFVRIRENHVKPRLFPTNIYRYSNFKEVEPGPVVPKAEVSNLVAKFKRELEAVATVAKTTNTQVIVASEVPDENAAPWFSYHSKPLTDDQKKAFDKAFAEGKQLFKNGKYAQAISTLLPAHRMDEGFAMVSYLLGQSYLHLGKAKEGFAYLRIAAETDGFKGRTPYGMFEVSKEVDAKFDNVHYIDTIEKFHLAYAHDLTARDWFTNPVHPSAAGHIIIAHDYLCKLAEMPILKQQPAPECIDFAKTDFKALVPHYKKALGVTSDIEAFHAYWITRSNVSYAARSAYPDVFLERARASLKRYYEKSQKTKTDEATVYLYEFIIEGLGEKRQDVALEYLNKGLALDREFMLYWITAQFLTTGEALKEIMQRLNIQYSETKQAFVRVSSS